MKTIPLTRGKVALVDDEDYEPLAQHKWQVRASHGRLYAQRCVGGRKDRRTVHMHREIMQPSIGLQVDHVNGDGLDNRRRNLRTCLPGQQQQNMHARRGRSGLKGVCFKKRGKHVLAKPWMAQIVVNGKAIHLGYHASAEDAARAYDAAALQSFGQFAQLNIPSEGGR